MNDLQSPAHLRPNSSILTRNARYPSTPSRPWFPLENHSQNLFFPVNCSHNALCMEYRVILPLILVHQHPSLPVLQVLQGNPAHPETRHRSKHRKSELIQLSQHQETRVNQQFDMLAKVWSLVAPRALMVELKDLRFWNAPIA